MTMLRPPPGVVMTRRFTPPKITPATVFGEITADGHNIVLTFSGDQWPCERAIDAVEELTPKGNVIAGGLAMTMPLTWPTYIQLACTFGRFFSCGGRLREWFLAELARRTHWQTKELRYQLPPGLALKQWQPESVRNIAHLGCLLEDDPRLGKAQRDDQPVLTPTGWVPIGKLNVGDQVIGSNGQPCNVTGVYPQGIRPLYEVTTSDGTTIVVDRDHLWATQTSNDRARNPHKWRVKTTATIAQELALETNDGRQHYLPMLTAPVTGKSANLPLDPWLIGVLIGDGSFAHTHVGLSNPDKILLAAVQLALPERLTLKPTSAKNPNGKDWYIVPSPGSPHIVRDALKALGLMGCRSHEKFIPDVLINASIEQRHALLTGLLDTDGYSNTSTGVEYSTSSPMLAESVRWLVQSLGGIATIYDRPAPTYTYRGEQRIGRPAWRLHINLPATIDPFAHSVKQLTTRMDNRKPPARRIVSVTPVADDFATCISIDAKDSLYATAGCVLTHNTISAIVGLAERACWPEYPPVTPIMVICPASVVTAWAREFSRWAPHWRVLPWRGGNTTERTTLVGTADVYVASYAIARRDAKAGAPLRDSPLAKIRPATVIIDEYHYCGNPESIQTQATQRLARLTHDKQGLVIPMSGTPFDEDINSAHPVWKVFEPQAYPSRERMAARWWLDEKAEYGREYKGINPATEHEFRTCFLGRQLRRSRADVAPWLSDKTYSTRVVPIPGKYLKEYRRMEQQMIAEVDNGECTPMSTITKVQRLQQLAASACDVSFTYTTDEATGLKVEHQHLHPKLPSWKIEAMIEVLAELRWPAIAFGISKPLMVLAGQEAARQGARVGYVVGGQTTRERDHDIDAFQAGKLDLLSVVIEAGGTGLTLNMAGTEIFLQRHYSYKKSTQADDRGIGERYPTLDIVDIVAENSIDNRIREVLHNKAAKLSEYFGDPRIVRQLFGGEVYAK